MPSRRRVSSSVEMVSFDIAGLLVKWAHRHGQGYAMAGHCPTDARRHDKCRLVKVAPSTGVVSYLPRRLVGIAVQIRTRSVENGSSNVEGQFLRNRLRRTRPRRLPRRATSRGTHAARQKADSQQERQCAELLTEGNGQTRIDPKRFTRLSLTIRHFRVSLLLLKYTVQKRNRKKRPGCGVSQRIA